METSTDRALAFNAATDLALTIMPFLIVRKLRLARSTKIVLSIILGMSVLSMAACIIKTVELHRLSESKDLTYDTGRFIIWLALERYIAIIVVSIQTIRPLALLVLRNRLKWFRTPSDHSRIYCDRTWIARNPTRFTLDSELQTFDGRRSCSLSRPPLIPCTEEPICFQLGTFEYMPSRSKRGLPIKKMTTVIRNSVEREEGDGYDQAFIDVSGIMRTSVNGPHAIKTGSWSNK